MVQAPAARSETIVATAMLRAGTLTLLLAACASQPGGEASPTPVPEGTTPASSTPVPASTIPAGAPSPPAPSSTQSDALSDPVGPLRPGDGPPDLFLSVDGASPVVGLPGGGCWASSTEVGCADTGWLVPETPIEATRGARMWVEVGAPYALTGWSVVAQAADAPIDSGKALELGNRQPGPAVPPTPIVLASLPAGDWVVSASVWFLRGGDVSFYWRVRLR